mgnify:CR=1 FL=1
MYQDFTGSTKAIEDGDLDTNEVLTKPIDAAVANGRAVHLLGLLSPGGVHSHEDHFIAMAELAARRGAQRIYVHAFLDGRDMPPQSALASIERANARLSELVGADNGFVASIIGRFFAMDRDNRWDRVAKAYEAIVQGKGSAAPTARDAVNDAYGLDENDEFITPTVLEGYTGVQDGDGIFCLNFRADRAREIMSALADPEFDAFDTGARPAWSAVMGMAEYSDAHGAFMTTMYPKPEIVNTLGAWVAQHGLRQFRLAETEKYPHVTFFLNGGEETPTTGEDRYMPKSPNVATYDLQPEMSCAEVTDRFVQAIKDRYDLIVVNYANPDMVGHTGDLDAAIAGVFDCVDTGGDLEEALLDQLGRDRLVLAPRRAGLVAKDDHRAVLGRAAVKVRGDAQAVLRLEFDGVR